MNDRRPKKRSLNLRGHQTSVSLEDEFWDAFREVASVRKMPLNALAAEIDADRGMDLGLASAIRVYVLEHYRKAGSLAPSEAGLDAAKGAL